MNRAITIYVGLMCEIIIALNQITVLVREGQTLREGGNATDFMCVHIRRTDFLDFGIGSDLNSTLLATKDIASRKRIQTVRISEFSEIADLYISYRLCSAFLMSAASSTFGWWLAFFSQDQDSVYYYKDKRPTDDYKLLKDEFQLWVVFASRQPEEQIFVNVKK
ncbi:hypothetical protein ANCDUO_10187 [Ancylostoma duodenale]|uniref:Uncharacterized protein n=1 Tax=Ancylostoma duodenale TaxID=51022 RepID=A0A0C2GEH7_9BILA|nr:hypothetical protein ANCDUO_10187 [Ancylostoma duodenale]